MNRIKNILIYIVLISGLTSCVEFFRPMLEGSDTKKFVIDGFISDQEGFQVVSVSLTSSVDDPRIKPLPFCDVKIIDDLGNEFKLDEFERGKYRVWLGKNDLKSGVLFRVKVLTPNGVEILSDFDQMPEECPRIDSIYYKRKDFPAREPNKTIQAIQFYVDFTRKSTSSFYYRWEVVETWEHHAVYPLTWYLLGGKGGPLTHKFPPDYSRFTCWTTERIKNVFTHSADNSNRSDNKMFSLHLVDNQTQRLTFCYSVLIYQHAISESAYKYFEKLRINSNEQGGLYSTQPLQIKGNLKCTTNPELEVLGFFSASSVKSKRAIVRNIENFDVLEPSCIPPNTPGIDYKYFMKVNDEGPLLGIFDDCVECDYMSGSTNKPDYWPY